MPYTDLPQRRSSLRPGGRRRSNSRVHFQDDGAPPPSTPVTEDILRDYQGQDEPRSSWVSSSSNNIASLQPAHAVSASSSQPEWHVPDYGERSSGLRASASARPHCEVSPLSDDAEDRRKSDASGATLYDDQSTPDGKAVPYKKNSEDSRYSLSSYRHPHDIRPPGEAYAPNRAWNRQSSPPAYWRDGAGDPEKQHGGPDDEKEDEVCNLGTREDRQRGYLSNMIDLYANENGGREDGERGYAGRLAAMPLRRRLSSFDSTAPRPNYRRFDSCTSAGSQVLDPDDPTVTGERKQTLDDPEDIERACMKQMSYKARRKYQQRIRIEFNITCASSPSSFVPCRTLLTFTLQLFYTGRSS